MTKLALLAVALFAVGCSKDAPAGPSKADKAAACTAAHAAVKGALKAEGKAFDDAANKMLVDCGAACDAGDDASCKLADNEGWKYCSITEDMCKAACGSSAGTKKLAGVCGILNTK